MGGYKRDMPKGRTYRLLPLLLAASLFLGFTMPTVAAVCAATSNHMQAAADMSAMPCHGEQTPASTPVTDETPCGTSAPTGLRLCCIDTGVADEVATVGVNIGSRLLEPALAAVLPLEDARTSGEFILLPPRQARDFAAWPAADRLAFLGAYLI